MPRTAIFPSPFYISNNLSLFRMDIATETSIAGKLASTTKHFFRLLSTRLSTSSQSRNLGIRGISLGKLLICDNVSGSNFNQEAPTKPCSLKLYSALVSQPVLTRKTGKILVNNDQLYPYFLGKVRRNLHQMRFSLALIKR